MSHVVLLGDSIFDNAVYVPGEPPVIEQVRRYLPAAWQATLLAVDGDVTSDVLRQTQRLPDNATHLVMSCGGNDALRRSGVLGERIGSVAEGFEVAALLRGEFRTSYRKTLEHLLSFNKPLAVCTVYDAVPVMTRYLGLAMLKRAPWRCITRSSLKKLFQRTCL